MRNESENGILDALNSYDLPGRWANDVNKVMVRDRVRLENMSQGRDVN